MPSLGGASQRLLAPCESFLAPWRPERDPDLFLLDARAPEPLLPAP